MGPRALILWGTAAVVSTVAAVTVSLERPSDVAEAARVDEPVFPALRRAPETAAVVAIAHGGRELRVERDGERWIVPAEHGYDADVNAVRDLLTGLADLRWAAPRTALAERYPRLDVDAPGPHSAADRVTVTADDGAVLADAVVGKRSRAITGDERGTYLRLPEGERAWLAKGTVDVATAAVDWLATDLPSVAQDELETLVVTPAEGAGFTVARTSPEEDLTLVDRVPADRSTDPDAIRRLAGVVAGLRFEDVLPAAAVDWPETVTTVTATSFAGETIELELATLEGEQRWVRFAAIGDWVYKLPSFQLDRLDKHLADLLAEPDAS
jgi:hypothetical protein